MRIESSVTAITWLPFAALDALPNMPLGFAVAHYDEPPGEVLGDVDRLREADAFREANQLSAWIEADEGEIVGHGHEGRGLVGGVGRSLGREQLAFPAVEYPVIQPEPEVADSWVRFTQTVGGRIGLPAPRPVRGKPYFHIGSALAWTTVELLIRADGVEPGATRRGEPVPAARGLRRGRQARGRAGPGRTSRAGTGTPSGRGRRGTRSTAPRSRRRSRRGSRRS